MSQVARIIYVKFTKKFDLKIQSYTCKLVRIIYVKYTKKFIPKNSNLHVETCTYNIRQVYEEIYT